MTLRSTLLEAVRQAIAPLCDPEIPVIRLSELGIVRGIRMATDGVPEVIITPTYTGCPAMGQIEDDIHQALKNAGLPGRVLTQLAPAWTTDWMSPAAKEKLLAYGIAPPNACAPAASDLAQTRVLQFSRAAAQRCCVPCPQCGSDNTTEMARFASTACKALYRCLDCLEPFDHFKAI